MESTSDLWMKLKDMGLLKKKELSVERNEGTGKGSFVNGGVRLEPWSGSRRMGWMCW